jgi:tRNA threonylcarbamoyl adenosine modification protein (Sua5/YciO/YrdC/YwlC family)
VHPDNPQPRLVLQVAREIEAGGVVAYPTSSGYALGCRIGDAEAVERIRAIRGIDDKHNFTLMCASIAQASDYAKLDNNAFKLVKRADPGKFTFILRALPELPKKLHSKRVTVGVRLASFPFVEALLEELGEPILSTSLLVRAEDAESDDAKVFSDPWEVKEQLGHQLDMVVDAGEILDNPTTVVDLSEGGVEIIRQGQGDL